jgi:hypothetical protein
MTTTQSPLTVRNLAALKRLPDAGLRTLQHQQVNHPDHRVMTDAGGHLPCPSNGTVKETADMDFRRTSIDDIPSGMNYPRSHDYPQHTSRGPLGRSKWDMEYMEPGNSIATRIWVSPSNKEGIIKEYKRIRGIGMTMCRYKRVRGYISLDFKIQTTLEDIIVGTLPGGLPIKAPHIVFWRVDGTKIDPYHKP